jgi:hypothetical protein
MRRDAWSPVVPPFRHELMRFCDFANLGNAATLRESWFLRLVALRQFLSNHRA